MSFQCTVKLHFAGGTRHPVQHSCKLSLAVLGGSQPCFMLEGAGMGKLKKMKVNKQTYNRCNVLSIITHTHKTHSPPPRPLAHKTHTLTHHPLAHYTPPPTQFSRRDLKSVAATRINEGRLSVTVYNQEWDTIVLTDVQDRRSLGQLHRQLEGLFHGTFPAGIKKFPVFFL